MNFVNYLYLIFLISDQTFEVPVAQQRVARLGCFGFGPRLDAPRKLFERN